MDRWMDGWMDEVVGRKRDRSVGRETDRLSLI